jgi:inhibitor of KinA
MAPVPYHIYPCGDHAITIELGVEIAVSINQKVIALFHYLTKNPLEGVKDIIPAYTTLTLVYDTSLLKKKYPEISVYERMSLRLQQIVEQVTTEVASASVTVKIPVCYDLSLAPDIASLAEIHQLTTAEIIQLHTGKTYRVYMIGFLPGFAYMGPVDKKIITPRRSEPRKWVPAGSIGIAGEQTGIYPFDSPGGWQLIGRTPVRIFDPGKREPCFLQPGNQVEFYSIPIAEFAKLQNT